MMTLIIPIHFVAALYLSTLEAIESFLMAAFQVVVSILKETMKTMISTNTITLMIFTAKIIFTMADRMLEYLNI